MKKEEMLRQIGDIDDKFIEEADKEPLRVAPTVKKGNFDMKRWGRWAAGVAAAFVIFVGCNAVVNSDFFRMGADKETAGVSNDMGSMGFAGLDEESTALDVAPMDKGQGIIADNAAMAPESGVDLKQHAGVKLIYNADLNLETVDFEDTIAKLKESAEAHGGYVESSYVDNGSYGDIDYCKNGNYVIRIPQGGYKDFINEISGEFNVTRLNESIDDIGEEYFDTEARIETLRIKQTRLQDMLKQATAISDIIEIENALTDTEYQLEMYTSTLNRYDSLVGFSTVTVWVQQVEHLGSTVDAERGFFASIGYALKNGVVNFFDSLELLAYNIAYNIISIIIIVAILVVCWKKKVISRIVKLFQKKDRL